MAKDGSTRKSMESSAIAAIEKAFGKGAHFSMGQDPLPYEGLSTGLLSLDIALGGQGIPRGRLVELYGAEAGGKSSLALQVIASAQAQGELCYYIDAEHALDLQWCAKLGAKLEHISQPSYGEEGLQIAEIAARSGAFSVIVVDSVAALIPKHELDGEIGDIHVGLQARMMGQAMRKLVGACASSGTIIIFINQLRSNIGVKYGDPNTTPGGRALKFYASVRLEMSRKSWLNSSGDELKEIAGRAGIRTRCKIVKNKVCFPGQPVLLDLYGERGWDRAVCVADVALDRNVIARTGAWYTYGTERINGKTKLIAWLNENPETMREIAKRSIEAAKAKG